MSVGGASGPIAFAVLSLITNSSLFGAWTGRLTGLLADETVVEIARRSANRSDRSMT
jgi:hypothetical protein